MDGRMDGRLVHPCAESFGGWGEGFALPLLAFGKMVLVSLKACPGIVFFSHLSQSSFSLTFSGRCMARHDWTIVNWVLPIVH